MKNQYRLDDLVTLVNIDGKWWAVAKDVGKLIGYKSSHHAFNKYCTESEIMVTTIQDKDQKRNRQLVSRIGIYELLEKTSLDIADEKVKWICEKLIKTMKSMNQESCPREIDISKAECIERNKIEKERLLKDVIKRNTRIRELSQEKNQMQEIIRHKDYKISDRNKRIDELKYELKNANKLNRDLEIEILHLDSEYGKEKIDLLESNLEYTEAYLENAERDLQTTIGYYENEILNTKDDLQGKFEEKIRELYSTIGEYQIGLKNDKETIRKQKRRIEHLNNLVEDCDSYTFYLKQTNEELKDKQCFICRLKERFKLWES